MKEQYRLPNNEYTEDKELCADEWHKIGDRLSELLDVELHGFDPGFLVGLKDTKYTGYSYNIPTWLAMKIIEIAEKSGQYST